MKTISAFTIIKNSSRFDYPIIESINSLLPYVQEYIVNVGISEDDTEKLICDNFGNNPKVKIFFSNWEDKSQGTNFFSSQTNKALDKCSNSWAMYLQADEVIHEKDGVRLQETIEKAEAAGKIAILFKYLHFEKNYNKLRKTYSEGFDCYEEEIRLIKNNKTIMSWGDAQSFCKKSNYGVFLKDSIDECEFSDMNIFHYGYVRDPKKMLDKKVYLNNFYWSDPSFSEEQKQKELNKIKNADKDEYKYSDQLNDFYGSHPLVMRNRIEEFNKNYPELLK